MNDTGGTSGSLQSRLVSLVESKAFTRSIMAVILTNAAVLGLETSGTVMAEVGPVLRVLDKIALVIFVVELTLKMAAYRANFFRRPWCLFDFVIVAVTLMPANEGFAALRAMRVLRAFRLMSVVPSMRRVVGALLSAVPGMGSVAALLALVFYVFAVMATKMFGDSFPDWFGSLGASFYSLFQIMTLESWSMGIVRPVMETYPFAWAFFVPFILCTTFAVLNLFIAIIVNAMHEEADPDQQKLEDDHSELMREVRALRQEIAQLRKEIPSQ
ncbi:MAG: ion transporter [Alphaproteobacteria bacterium]